VRVVAHARFCELIIRRGLSFAQLDGDLNALLTAPSGRAALTSTQGPLQTLRASLAFLRAARPLYAAMLESAWEQARDAGLLIATLPTAVAGTQIAEALGIPCVLALLQPLGCTSAFPSPMQPFHASLGPAYNRLSHAALNHLIWWPWRAEVARWRTSQLLLRPLPLSGPIAVAEQRGLTALYGFSQHVVLPPPDWPNWRQITGFWFLERPAEWRPPAALEHFLAAGPPPVYLGLGSMGPPRSPAQIQAMVGGLRQAGLRGLLAIGGPIPAELDGPDLLAIGDTWHDWLFPQLALAIHHGGAGTTAATLRAGIPSICLPVGVDQLFWGHRVNGLGCGAPPLPLGSLSSHRLAAAIQQSLSPEVRQAAAAMGQAIREELGAEVAAGVIDALEQNR
jgi:sterol 3beta-glucosyltransferase